MDAQASEMVTGFLMPPKWEYRTVAMAHDYTVELQVLGREGWEAYAVVAHTDFYIQFLKRPLTEGGSRDM